MNYTDLLTILGINNDVPALAGQVVARAQEPAWELVGNSIQGMSRHEATGYVRARTRTLLKRTVARLCEDSFAQPNKTARVFDEAAELLCARTLEQLQRQKTEQPRRQAA